jgi:hypothetical protein
METAYIRDGSRGFDRIRVTLRDSDGFIYALSSTDVELRLCPSEVFASAYLVGRAQGGETGNRRWRDIADFSDAALSWKMAGQNHAHTSYYGAGIVRDFRAYWLGRLRTVRGTARG